MSRCILRKCITLDQECGAKFEHIAEHNTRTDGLSRLAMSNDVPQNLITEVYAIDELHRDINTDFPLTISLIKAEQEKDAKLQTLLKQGNYISNFGIFNFWRL